MARRACKNCKRIIEGAKCVACGSTELTSSFQGTIVIFSPESEIAKKLGITAPGTYAVRV